MPLSSAYAPPLALIPRTALAAACPCLSARPTHPVKTAARTPAREHGSQPGSGLAFLSPLFPYLSVCPLNPLARSPRLPLADSPRVACLTVFHPLSLRLALGPMPRLGPGYHSHPLTPARLHSKCVRISATLDLTVPQLVFAARDTIAAGRCIVLMARTAETAACERPLVACRTYFVSAWCGPLGPRIRFPGEM